MPNYGAGEYVLTASLCLKSENNFAEQGFEIAFGQAVFQSKSTSNKLSAWFKIFICQLKKLPLLRVVQSYGVGFEVLFNEMNYVGQTIQKLSALIYQHRRSEKPGVNAAIKEYGWDNFFRGSS